MTTKEALAVIGRRDPFYPMDEADRFRQAVSVITSAVEEHDALKAEAERVERNYAEALRLSGAYKAVAEYDPHPPGFVDASEATRSRADLCPVCRGAGKVPGPYVNPADYTGIYTHPQTCHGCGGVGWVIVQEKP